LGTKRAKPNDRFRPIPVISAISLFQDFDPYPQPMSKSVLFAFVALAASFLAACKADRDVASAPSEAENAAKYVVYEMARGRSPSVRSAGQACSDACVGGGGSEVVIGLLGIGGEATTGPLLNLLAVQLDAGMAEARSCQIAKRGKSILPALERLDAARLSAWCQSTVDDLMKQELSNVRDVTLAQICRPAADVEADQREWLGAVQSGRDLFSESGPC
jgi:hypothetical protein